MAKAAEHPSNLFRSLRPDDEDFQTNTGAAAREAEQRWPLFKAVAPRKQQATPLLSPQERSLWSTTQKPSGYERKPALSVPATGNKLAQSLNKMGGRPTSAPLTRSPQRTREEESYQEPVPAPSLFTREEEPAKKRGLLFSKDVSAAVEQPYQDQEAARTPQKFGRSEPARGRSEPARGRNSLFSKGAAPEIEDQAEVRSAAGSGDSLTRLFNRLEGQEEPAEKPVGKKSALFGRPGKR
jgi:hypothetical protein